MGQEQRWYITRIVSVIMQAGTNNRSSTFFHVGLLVMVSGLVAAFSALWREGDKGGGGGGPRVGLQGTMDEKRRILVGV